MRPEASLVQDIQGLNIFLPAAGFGSGIFHEFYDVGSCGYCWSSTPVEHEDAFDIYFDIVFNSDHAGWNYTGDPSFMLFLRPVR